MEIPLPEKKKGLGAVGWLGVGCGSIMALCLLGTIIFGVFFGGKEWVQEAQTNPTRATATVMVKLSRGTFEMVAQDDINKRYTVRHKASGVLTTVYWSEKTKKPETISGDFSAIPKDEPAGSAPVPAPPAAPAR